MLEDIEVGYISTVIVKDLSRLGRNYVEVGNYTEVYFPDRNIRFIAVNDMVAEKNYLESELGKALAKNEKVAVLYEKLYEDNADGKVTDEWFMQLSYKYEVERMELKTKITDIRQKIFDIGESVHNKDMFLIAIRKFMEMDKLTVLLLIELIEKIEVYEIEGVGKNRTQRIVIHYRFVGHIELPDRSLQDNYVADTRKGVAVRYIPKALPA